MLDSLDRLTRSKLLEGFHAAWAMTETLFSSLRDEQAFLESPPHGLRHPLIFYYAHPAVFYANKLRQAGLLQKPLHASFEALFAVGVDEHSWDDINKSTSVWPALEDVKSYRQRVFDEVSQLISSHPSFADGAPFNEDAPSWALLMALEHEWIHIETSSVLIREMPLDLFLKPQRWPEFAPRSTREKAPGPPAWLAVDKGVATLGRPQTFAIYSWDNENGSRREVVEAFEAKACLVSNSEFLIFVEEGGYRDESLWSNEGWAWRAYRQRHQPAFWIADGHGELKLRTIFEHIPLPGDWPVIVNFHEANAYATWLSTRSRSTVRLPSEAESQRMRAIMECEPARFEDWFGHDDRSRHPLLSGANLGWRYGSESPVDADYQERGAKLCDVVGNVWQWCEDIFAPLPGFETHPLYPDYSTPSFDGRHRLLLGGSFASHGSALAPWTRNNFREHFLQHAGFRLIRSRS